MRFVSLGKDPKTGKVTRSSGSEQDYADHADAYFIKVGFTEHELAHTVHRFGNAATVLSSYEGKETGTGKPADRGCEHFPTLQRWQALVDSVHRLGRGTAGQSYSVRVAGEAVSLPKSPNGSANVWEQKKNSKFRCPACPAP